MVPWSLEFQFYALGHVPVILNSDKYHLIFPEVQLEPALARSPRVLPGRRGAVLSFLQLTALLLTAEGFFSILP